MNLLTISDLNKNDIDHLLERAVSLKKQRKRGIPYQPLQGKTLALMFEKSSTRTRVSFETAIYQMGGNATFISPSDSHIGRGEPVKDTARVMSRYVDAVVVRTFAHETIEEFAGYASIPVINGLTDLHHPCQVLADILTIIEKKGGYEGLKAAWVGAGNNMANSWIEAASILGFDLELACPGGYHPNPSILKRAKAIGNSRIIVTEKVEEAVSDSDVLNTDVWASMGEEAEQEERQQAFQGYSIDSKVLALANRDAIVMHCLPAHRGEEITEEVIEGANSVVWEQAENRLHIQKAVLEWLMVK